jgi:hypothetical protein
MSIRESTMRLTIVLGTSLLLLTTSIALATDGQGDGVIMLRPVEPEPTRLVSTTVTAVSLKADKPEPKRRCAFLGQCGSFTLISSNGTAAYVLGNERYIADLKSAGEDPNWWLYVPAGGDLWTQKWAFARNPECGKYRVLRRVNGTWWEFDRTDAWGAGLGGSRAVPTAAAAGEPSNQQILNKLLDIEEKLNVIQPGPRPSLQDLENQIQRKP